MREFITSTTIKNQIAIITLDSFAALSALSHALIDELSNVIKAFDEDSNILCTIITGYGDKAFCAGADLKERVDMTQDEVMDTVDKIGSLVTQIENMKMPIIAAINGLAFGGGLELAIACDIRLAEKQAKMGLTETSLAVIPGAGGTQRLSRLIGISHAKYMIYTAQPIDANHAFEIGLVQNVTETGESLNQAVEIAKRITQNGPIAIKAAKKAIDSGYDLPLKEALEYERSCYLDTLETTDRIEGLNSFVEKRKPNYKGE